MIDRASGTPAGSLPRGGSAGIIRWDALFLGFMAAFGLSQDIASYLLGSGRFGRFLFEDPRALGFVEAHGLAAMLAAAAFIHARRNPFFWHNVLGTVHAFLGLCNLVFFEAFVATGDTRLAGLVTSAHLALATLNAVAMTGLVPNRTGLPR